MSDTQHEIDRARIAALEAEVDELQEQLRQLRDEQLGARWMPPLELQLTNSEARLLGALAARPGVRTKQQLMSAIYHLQSADDEPHEKIVDVFVCKIRRKLKPYRIEIVTRWGVGWELTESGREQLLEWAPMPRAVA